MKNLSRIIFYFIILMFCSLKVHCIISETNINYLCQKLADVADSNQTSVQDLEVFTEKLKILLNISDFKLLRLYGPVFVDKSEMINEYLERGGIVLTITRPTKWGKSLNIDMFRKFFEIEVDKSGNILSEENRSNKILFTGGIVKLENGDVKQLEPLKISNFTSAMDHQGSNPVILLSLKDVTGRSFSEFLKSMENTIKRLFSKYPYLTKYMGNQSHPLEGGSWKNIFDSVKLENSLHFLSKLLFKHFKKNVYIFVDDYDSPTENAYTAFGAKSEDFKKVLEMTYGIIGKALKDNWYLERAILIGTFHFGWVNEILKLNNVRHSTIVDMTFSPFFGFTIDEVNNVLRKVMVQVDPIQIKKWYNGYDFDRVATYNPWSLLSCLANRGQLNYYWGEIIQASSKILHEVFLLDGPQEYLQKLLQDNIIIRKEINKPINLVKMEDTFHRVLLFGGFFNSIPGFCESNCYIHPWNLSIPNQEVRGILAEGVSKWVASKLNISIAEYTNMLKILISHKIDLFSAILQKHLSNSVIPRTPIDQQIFHHQLVGGLISSLGTNYKIKSSRRAGQKSREYMLTPLSQERRDIIMVEYEVGKAQKKMASAAEIGINKLIGKEFCPEIKHIQNYSKLSRIYIVLCKKKVVLKYKVSEIG